MTINPNSILPDIPLTCLKSAEIMSTSQAFEGKNTVIDFWTTKCTRCPDALDNLDFLATHSKYNNIEFNSIVLDECDGARNIIETDDEPRWKNVNHYYMDKEFKEMAKASLGFKQVPFYVVLNERGEIVQKGSKKQIDFDSIPGIEREDEESLDSNSKSINEEEESAKMERVFCLDDFDF